MVGQNAPLTAPDRLLARRLPGQLLGWSLCGLLIAGLLLLPAAAWAGPVSWQEVPVGERGRQWWDAGSVHPNRDGNLVVLSRFQPAADPDHPDQPPPGRLFVSELDCAQELYRDTSINGLPQWRAEWQAPAADDPGLLVLREVCAAASRPGG